MQIEEKELLVEIGVEELPVKYIEPALNSWSSYIHKQLNELQLHHAANGATRFYSTPRRLVLLIDDIKEKQADTIIDKTGPSVEVAFNEQGKLTKAGIGFLRGLNIDGEKLNYELVNNNSGQDSKPYIKKSTKGNYLSVKQNIKGKQSTELLKDLLPESFNKINFPKMMRWNSKNFKFARPIRWVLALYGERIIPFEIGNLTSNNVTYGNIFEKEAEPIIIENISEYLSLLKDKFVIADRNERKHKTLNEINKLSIKVNGFVADNILLEEVTDIVEYPTAVLAMFDQSYLSLPAKVVHSTLVKNQRYFPVYNDQDDLMNYFIFVANNLPKHAENTKLGNEKVVKARLADADFYFREDKSKSIAYFNSKLEGIVFHIKLGTVKEKVDRIVEISKYLCRELELEGHLQEKVLRAARICKFDLATAMINEKEFASLQGYIGKEYALIWGEDKEVADAIEDHYLPLGLTKKSRQDNEQMIKIQNHEYREIPSKVGRIVSLADKIDTLCCFFGINLIPTGSKDQYSLRRAGNSIVKLIHRSSFSLSIQKITGFTYSLINHKLQNKFHNQQELFCFFEKRIEQYLQTLGISYDIVNTVLATEFDIIIKVINKAQALRNFKNKDDFKHLILSYKRVSNIIAGQSISSTINKALFKQEAEQKLYQSIIKTKERVTTLLQNDDYDNVLQLFISLNEVIDVFFNNVLVNEEDEEIRNNRYALLNLLRELFLNIGDLSLITIENEK